MKTGRLHLLPQLIPTTGRDEEILRRNYGSSVLISPQRREWAEMRNDPSGFVPRKCEYDAHKKTRHAGDCVATQTGHDKGWDGARPPLATDFRAQSSLCSLSDRLLSARVSPRVCLAKKKSATDGCRSTAPARLVGPGRRVLGANHPDPGLGPHRRRRRRHSLKGWRSSGLLPDAL